MRDEGDAEAEPHTGPARRPGAMSAGVRVRHPPEIRCPPDDGNSQVVARGGCDGDRVRAVGDRHDHAAQFGSMTRCWADTSSKHTKRLSRSLARNLLSAGFVRESHILRTFIPAPDPGAVRIRVQTRRRSRTRRHSPPSAPSGSRCTSSGPAFRGGRSSSWSAADVLAQEERGPVKRLAGLVEYAGE
jgi:hypothetical protein